MRKFLYGGLFCLFLVSNLNAQKAEIWQKLDSIAIVDQKVMMPMRDGIRLCTDIYRPKTSEPVGIVFSRTPYNFNGWGDGEQQLRHPERAYEFVKRGFAYVIQNERGRYFSEGEWDILGLPLTDAEDAFSWLADQEWSNGKIIPYGCSSTAEWQMAAASLNHPALVALIPQGYGAGVGRVGDYFEQGNWYRGGAHQMLFTSWLYSVEHDKFKPRIPAGATQEDIQRISRYYDLAPENPPVDMSEALKHLPVKDILKNVDGKKEIFDKMILRKPNDPAWHEGGLYHDNMDFNVPSFWFCSWYDVSISPNLALFNHVRNHENKDIADNQYMIIAPTLHCRFTRATENTIVGDRSVGDARLNYFDLLEQWCNMWLHDEENEFKTERPHVQYYTMGSNKWQSSETWPPENTVMTKYYLNSGGNANTRFGDGLLSMKASNSDSSYDTYTYDPMDPVMSHGGNVCCTGNAIQGGSFDQSEMEKREDILVYTTDVLEEDTEVSGFIEARIYVSSDAKDTDFTIKLIDVYPDGQAYNLDETIQRARYREGYETEVFMEDNEIYEINFTPMSTSNCFKKGHRIRIEISSSNFPRFSRNLNTGGNNFDESESVIAVNKVHHSKEHQSFVNLPIKQ